MMRRHRTFVRLGLFFAALLALSACRSTEEITNFDPAAHQRAADLKTDVLALVAQSGEPFSQHSAAVETVNQDIQVAYEQAGLAADNELVTRQWELMKDPEQHLYGGFIRRWQTDGSVDPASREEMTLRITATFDHILCLEVAKRSPGACPEPATQSSPPKP